MLGFTARPFLPFITGSPVWMSVVFAGSLSQACSILMEARKLEGLQKGFVLIPSIITLRGLQIVYECRHFLQDELNLVSKVSVQKLNPILC